MFLLVNVINSELIERMLTAGVLLLYLKIVLRVHICRAVTITVLDFKKIFDCILPVLRNRQKLVHSTDENL